MAGGKNLEEVNLWFTGPSTSGGVDSGEKTPPAARRGGIFFPLLPPKWLQLLIVETFYSAEEAVL